MKTITDVNKITKVLTKMSLENDFDIDNVYVNPDFKYIETNDFDKKDADFCSTTYRGDKYKVRYFSGCFNPYLVKLNN